MDVFRAFHVCKTHCQAFSVTNCAGIVVAWSIISLGKPPNDHGENHPASKMYDANARYRCDQIYGSFWASPNLRNGIQIGRCELETHQFCQPKTEDIRIPSFCPWGSLMVHWWFVGAPQTVKRSNLFSSYPANGPSFTEPWLWEEGSMYIHIYIYHLHICVYWVGPLPTN